jgi:hypothetical protein
VAYSSEKQWQNFLKIEILSIAATWMKLWIVMLSEISQAQKNKHQMISLIHGIQKQLIS